MNVAAQNYIVNDIDTNLNSLYYLFKNTLPETIISHVHNRIDEFNLAKERTKRNVYTDKEKIKEYKEAYMKFRSHYNKNKTVLDFYTLMFYSFSQQFRFNSKGEFNMPYGTDCFSFKNEEYIYNGFNFFSQSNVIISATDYKNILLNSTNLKDSFFYCDPPYLNTTAVYNENNGWNKQDEQNLHKCLDVLSLNGGKWALSSVIENKGYVNSFLVEWLNNHKEYNVYSFDKQKYSACGKGNSNAKEVLITNYKE